MVQPARHHRRSIRLRGFDYASPGAYFVTICVQGRECLLGEVVDGEMQLTNAGQIARDEWLRSAAMRPRVILDAFVVMPNHIHGIIILADDGGRGTLCRGTLQRAPTIEPTTTQCAPTIESVTTERAPTIEPTTTQRAPTIESVTTERAPTIESVDGGGRGTLCRGTLQRAPTIEPAAAQRAPTVERFGKPTPDSIPTIVRLFKAATTKRVNELRHTPGLPFWQRNYWEHVIRDEDSLNRIRQYIESNPARWDQDQLHPAAPPNPFNQVPAKGRGVGVPPGDEIE